MLALLRRLTAVSLLLVTISTFWLPPRVQATAFVGSPRCHLFPETGVTVCSPFLDLWERWGGRAIFGLPLTAETSENETEQIVQWFERARFERQTEASDFQVSQGLLGREVTRGREGEPPFRAAEPRSGCLFFPETNHNLCGGFLAYWERFGGLPVFGYPISEEFLETDPVTGTVRTVQYFERHRFEWHPGIWPERFDVLLGRLGASLLSLFREPGDGLPATPAASPHSFGDGQYRIGVDITPGTYRNSGNDTACSWQRIRYDGASSEVVNVTSTLRQVVTLKPSDSEFSSRGCGIWEPATVPITDDPTAPFADGVYIVGLDIAPGLWRASATGLTCMWARLADFTGSPRDVIESKHPFDRRSTIRLDADDRGFFTFGCGKWYRIGD